MTTATAAISEHFQPVPSARGQLWAGRIVSGLAVLFLAVDAGFKLLATAAAAEASAQLGWSGDTIHTLGIIEVVCLAAYLVPRTQVLGALLWTAGLLFRWRPEEGKAAWLIPIFVAAMSVLCFSRYNQYRNR